MLQPFLHSAYIGCNTPFFCNYIFTRKQKVCTFYFVSISIPSVHFFYKCKKALSLFHFYLFYNSWHGFSLCPLAVEISRFLLTLYTIRAIVTKIQNNTFYSYPERWRDWPCETRQLALCITPRCCAKSSRFEFWQIRLDCNTIIGRLSVDSGFILFHRTQLAEWMLVCINSFTILFYVQLQRGVCNESANYTD